MTGHGHGRIDYAVCRASRGPGGLGLGEGAGDDRRDSGRTQHDDVECNEYNNWARREGGRESGLHFNWIWTREEEIRRTSVRAHA